MKCLGRLDWIDLAQNWGFSHAVMKFWVSQNKGTFFNWIRNHWLLKDYSDSSSLGG
jgi:hypothetical protein